MSNIQNQNSLKSFNGMLAMPQTKNFIKETLGSKSQQFTNNMVSLVANEKALQECAPQSLLYAGIKATALDLPLDNNLGFAYVLPYKGKDGAVAQFQMGYKGFIQLAMRSGQFKTINSREVKEGEIIGEDFMSGELEFKRLPLEERLKAKTVGFIAHFELLNGFKKTLYMTVEELQAHGKKYSKSYNSNYSNWKTNFEAMAEKTVLKRLLSKYAPLSIEMQSAIVNDQKIFTDENGEYIDNDQQQTNIEVVIKEKMSELGMSGAKTLQHFGITGEEYAKAKKDNTLADELIDRIKTKDVEEVEYVEVAENA